MPIVLGASWEEKLPVGRSRCRFRRPGPYGQAEEGGGASVQRESQRAHEGLLAILGTNDSQTQGKAKERKMIRKT